MAFTERDDQALQESRERSAGCFDPDYEVPEFCEHGYCTDDEDCPNCFGGIQ